MVVMANPAVQQQTEIQLDPSYFARSSCYFFLFSFPEK